MCKVCFVFIVVNNEVFIVYVIYGECIIVGFYVGENVIEVGEWCWDRIVF